jgi:hypothetical protein
MDKIKVNWSATFVFVVFVLGAFIPDDVLSRIAAVLAPRASAPASLPAVPDGGVYDPDEDDSQSDDEAPHVCSMVTLLIGDKNSVVLQSVPMETKVCVWAKLTRDVH